MSEKAAPKGFSRRYRDLLAAAVRPLASAGIAPDWLTLASLPPAILAGLAAAYGAFYVAALLFLASGVLDLLDGALARSAHRQTRFGALLDSTLDRLVDAAIPAGLIVFYAPHGTLVLLPALAIIAGFAISYIRARAEGLGIALPRLWLRRQDRFLILFAALLASPLPVSWIAAPAPVLVLAMTLLAALGFLAALSALRAAARRA